MNSVDSQSPVSYENFAPKTSTQRSHFARIEAWAMNQSPYSFHSQPIHPPTLSATADITEPHLFYKAMTPSSSSSSSSSSSTLSHIRLMDGPYVLDDDSSKNDSETQTAAISFAQVYTERLSELLDHTSDITTSLKMILTQHIPDLTLKHDALVHQSAEAILTAQRLEMDAATLFRHADEIATPLKRYDAVDTWSNVLGLVFHPWIQGNHSSGATAPGGGGRGGNTATATTQKQLTTIQKRITCRFKLDPVDDFVRALHELDEAITYFDSFIIMTNTNNNTTNHGSNTSLITSSAEEYSKRAKILRDEILDHVRESIIDRMTQTSNDIKTTLGLITQQSRLARSTSSSSSNTHSSSSSIHPTSSSHMGLSSTIRSSTTSTHHHHNHTYSSIHAVGGVVPGDVLEASLIYTRFQGISTRIYGLLRIIYQHMMITTTSSTTTATNTNTAIMIHPTYKVLWDTCRITYFSSRELLLRCSIRSHLELLKNKHGFIGMTRLASVFITRLCIMETALYLDFFGDRSFSINNTTNDNNDKKKNETKDMEEEDDTSEVLQMDTQQRQVDSSQSTSLGLAPSHKAYAPTLALELNSYVSLSLSSFSLSSSSSQTLSSIPEGGSYSTNVIGDTWFQSFMDTLCGHFHSTIRRGIVSLLDLDTLCQIIIILREEKNSIPPASFIVLAPAAKVMGMILEDVQERLIFCATTMVQREVTKFKPTPSDLDYPAKLLALQGADEEENDNRKQGSTNPNQLYESWFPPLKSSLRVLSKIFGVVENKVFEDVALTCVRACTQSLKDASIYLKQKNGPGGILHSDLFLIQHLLILREQLSPFDIQLQSVERQLDFSDAGKAVSKFWSKTKTSRKMLFAMSTENALLTLLKEGVSVKESPMDSKRDLEDALRSSCNDFIEHASIVLIGPILSVLEQYKSWSLTQEATGRRGSSVSSSTDSSSSHSAVLPSNLQASTIVDALSRTVDRFEPQHGEVLRQMSLYMDNSTTQMILLKPVIRKVQRSLEEVRRLFFLNTNSNNDSNSENDPSSSSTTAMSNGGWNSKMIHDATDLLLQIEGMMIKKSSSSISASAV